MNTCFGSGVCIGNWKTYEKIELMLTMGVDRYFRRHYPIVTTTLHGKVQYVITLANILYFDVIILTHSQNTLKSRFPLTTDLYNYRQELESVGTHNSLRIEYVYYYFIYICYILAF